MIAKCLVFSLCVCYSLLSFVYCSNGCMLHVVEQCINGILPVSREEIIMVYSSVCRYVDTEY